MDIDRDEEEEQGETQEETVEIKLLKDVPISPNFLSKRRMKRGEKGIFEAPKSEAEKMVNNGNATFV